MFSPRRAGCRALYVQCWEGRPGWPLVPACDCWHAHEEAWLKMVASGKLPMQGTGGVVGHHELSTAREEKTADKWG